MEEEQESRAKRKEKTLKIREGKLDIIRLCDLSKDTGLREMGHFDKDIVGWMTV